MHSRNIFSLSDKPATKCAREAPTNTLRLSIQHISTLAFINNAFQNIMNSKPRLAVHEQLITAKDDDVIAVMNPTHERLRLHIQKTM